MLFGEYLGRAEVGDLERSRDSSFGEGSGDQIRGRGSDRGLAASYVALKKPEHRVWLFKIGNDGADCAHLCLCGGEGEGGNEVRQPGGGGLGYRNRESFFRE